MGISRELLDTYDIYEEIGAGSGGKVYKAYHKRLCKNVIIKETLGVRASMDDYRIEVDILKNLRHSYLPSVIDFFFDEAGVYTIMDYIPGKSLEQMMNEGYRFTEEEVTRYMDELCDALCYLHSRKPAIIHGDIKPANIMITPSGDVCLIDFNISGILNGDSAVVYGYTPKYASPEQVEGSEGGRGAKVDVRSDIYSLGATFYTAMTGQTVANAQGRIEIPGVSDGFLDMISKAIEPNLKYRYKSVNELKKAINNIYKKSKEYRKKRAMHEIKVVAVLVVCALLVVVVIQGYNRIKFDRQNRFEEILEEIGQITEDEITQEEFEDKYAAALKLNSKDARLYYAKAYYMQSCMAYSDAIEYINGIYETIRIEDDEINSKLNYVAAECYFQLGDYSQAIRKYKTSINYDGTNSAVYRDYAIALVYNNQIDEANAVLDNAVNTGIREDDTYMVKGEIAKLSGNNEEALMYFRWIADNTLDDYLRLRAYVKGADVYESMGDVESLIDEAAWLSECEGKLLEKDLLIPYEKLSECYINLGNLTEKLSYYNDAIAVYEKVVAKNWGNINTYNNAIVLNERVGNLVEAKRWLSLMENIYPESYITHMRGAFIEADLQEAQSADSRNYDRFVAYYDKANELYNKFKKGNETDSEMLLLKETYNQLVSNGWIVR